MPALSHGLSWIDLQFLGHRRAIATGVVRGPGGTALVDPGPSTSLATLEAELSGLGASFDEVTHILLTHIHLDHAGGVGTIAAAHPHIRVLVHERGARHLADPARLVESARRVYGDRMDRLWGEIRPVAEGSLTALAGGERVYAGGRTFEVAYTPGHAAHHVSYFDADSGVAFVGDTAGICIHGGYVLPPTPPPDIDLELWRDSAARIERWSPGTLFLTHFGPVMDVVPHLRSVVEQLERLAGWARESLTDPTTDEQRSRRFADRLRQDMRRSMSDAQIAAYTVAAPLEQLWAGLARYWRKRGVG